MEMVGEASKTCNREPLPFGPKEDSSNDVAYDKPFVLQVSHVSVFKIFKSMF